MKILKFLMSILPFTLASYSHAEDICVNPKLPDKYLNKSNQAYLNLNNYQYLNQALPYHYRVLANYRIIASGQFSESQFVNATKGFGQVIDVDLRGEYHGFNQGAPFSYIALPNDDENLNKPQKAIINQENHILATWLPQYSNLQFYTYDLKSIPDKNTPVSCMKTKLETESQLVSKYNYPYYRITATDHIGMTPENVDQLIDLYDKYLKDNPKQWVYLHCHGGDGRTTSATIILIMLRQKMEHKLQSFPILLDYVEKTAGYKLKPECSRSNNSYKCQVKWRRYQTIEQIYQFMQQSAKNQKYSDWVKTKK